MFTKMTLSEVIDSMHVIGIFKFKIMCKKDRRKTKKKIEHIISSYGITNAHHEYDRALGNAIHYGEYPIKCRVYVGDHRQMICVIEDSGEGFDYKKTIKKFMNNEVYYHYHGYGMRCYAQNRHLQVDWNNHGATIILFYR